MSNLVGIIHLIQNQLKKILDNNNTILGFKEIRYSECVDLLDTFIELFPNTKIICHYRENVDLQCKSGWWTEKDKNNLLEYNEQLINYCNKNNKYCYLSTMEEMLNIEYIKKMFIFLEENFDKNKYKYILNDNMH